MDQIGTVASLWRYPVKSMGGEQVESAFAGLGGIRGDRVFAFHDAAAPADFPYFTARQREQMLLYRPRFRTEDSSGTVEVATPDGRMLGIEDPTLLEQLSRELDSRHHLSLMRSDRALTDAQPLSIFSIQTAQRLASETGIPIDKRRFRANIYLDLPRLDGFGEDAFVGHRLAIGQTVVIEVLERDPRCKIITLDPDTAEANPEVIKRLARAHETKAGIYAALTIEGTIRQGDNVHLLE